MITDTNLNAVRNNEMTFSQWASEHRQDVERIAAWAIRGWESNSVSTDDIQQEVLVAVHIALNEYDETRGYGLQKFVRWRACQAARDVLSRDGRMRKRETLSWHDALTEPRHTEAVVPPRLQLLDRMHLAESNEQAVIMGALFSTRNIGAAAAQLYADEDMKNLFGFASPKAAERSVYRRAKKLQSRALAAVGS